jgi:hypothetical protein
MNFKNENALIHGAGGTATREGSKVFPAGCRLGSVHNKVAKDILFERGIAEAPAVDALDEQAVGAQI